MTKATLSLCHFYAMFAEAHRLAGNIDEALRRIDNCIQFAAAVENRMLEALGQAES